MRQAQTAVYVYRQDVQPTLHGRQLFVRQHLVGFIERLRYSPTSLELVRYVASQYPQRLVDVNTIRPRLKEMADQGWVRHGEKRRCSISKKNVYTWEPSEPKPPAPIREPEPQRLEF